MMVVYTNRCIAVVPTFAGKQIGDASFYFFKRIQREVGRTKFISSFHTQLIVKRNRSFSFSSTKQDALATKVVVLSMAY